MPTRILAGYGHRFVQRQTGGAAGKDSRPTMGDLGVPRWFSTPRRYGPRGRPWGASMGFRPTVGGLGAASVDFRRSAFPCRRQFSRGMATGSFNGKRVGRRERIPALRRYWPRWVTLGWPRWIFVGRHSHADAHSREVWPPVRSTANGWGGGKGFPPYDGIGPDGFPDGAVLAPVGGLGVASMDFCRSAFPCRRVFSRGVAAGSFNGKRVGRRGW